MKKSLEKILLAATIIGASTIPAKGAVDEIPDINFNVNPSQQVPLNEITFSAGNSQGIQLELENILPGYNEMQHNWNNWIGEVIPLNEDGTFMNQQQLTGLQRLDNYGIRIINKQFPMYEIRATFMNAQDNENYKNLTFPYGTLNETINLTTGFVNTPNTTPQVDDLLELVSGKYLRGGDGSNMLQGLPLFPRELDFWDNNVIYGFELTDTQAIINEYNQDPQGFPDTTDRFKLNIVPAGTGWTNFNKIPLIWENDLPGDGGSYSPTQALKLARGPPIRAGPPAIREELESYLRIQLGDRGVLAVNDTERLVFIIGDEINRSSIRPGPSSKVLYDQYPPNSTTQGAKWPQELPPYSIQQITFTSDSTSDTIGLRPVNNEETSIGRLKSQYYKKQ